MPESRLYQRAGSLFADYPCILLIEDAPIHILAQIGHGLPKKLPCIAFVPKAEIRLFFRRAFSIIGPIRPKGTAVTRPSELTDWKRKAVDYKIAAAWNRKNPVDFLTEQFRNL